MNVLIPCARLLLAAALMILFPVAVAALGRSPAWLLVPLLPLSATSCILQGYRRPGVIARCVASNAFMLGIVYLIALGIFAVVQLR